MKVILDTNFILTCVKQKIDLFSRIEDIFPIAEILVPKQVILELETLQNRSELKLAERKAASLALQILEKKQVKILDLKGQADKAIVSYVLNNENIIMASLDGAMRKHVKGKAKMLTIRNKRRIVIS